jgi:transposase
MVAPRKYPDELRDRAVRLVREARAEPGGSKGACRRVGEQLGINPERCVGGSRTRRSTPAGGRV